MIFTTNKPLNEWGKVLHDEDMAAAILDRVLERRRFIHLDGPSGRTRHLNLEETLPKNTKRLRISGTHTPNSTRFHQSSIKPPTMSLNTPKPPTVKSLILLGLRVGGLGSFGLKAIRNRQVASSTLALGSNIPFTSSALRILLYPLTP